MKNATYISNYAAYEFFIRTRGEVLRAGGLTMPVGHDEIVGLMLRGAIRT